MRYLLPALMLLSACNSLVPAVPTTGMTQDSAFIQYTRISTDPAGVKVYIEQKLADKSLSAADWALLLKAAAENGNRELFSLLANATSQNQAYDLVAQRAQILLRAAGSGQTGMLEWLLKDPQWQRVGFNINEKDSLSGTPIFWAARSQKTETVDWLLANGADPKLEGAGGENSLNSAVASGNRALVDKFLALGLSLNPDQSRPPLFSAVENLNTDMITHLLAKGANLHATYLSPEYRSVAKAKPESALGLAARNAWQPDVIRLLLEKGATPDRSEHASAVGNLLANTYFESNGVIDPTSEQVLDLLLKYKPNLNATNLDGVSALSVAVQRGYHKAMEKFTAAGADLKASDDSGKTLLMYAAESGSLTMVQFLLYRGADVKAKDMRGQRALDYASDAQIVNYLASIPTS